MNAHTYQLKHYRPGLQPESLFQKVRAKSAVKCPKVDPLLCKSPKLVCQLGFYCDNNSINCQDFLNLVKLSILWLRLDCRFSCTTDPLRETRTYFYHLLRAVNKRWRSVRIRMKNYTPGKNLQKELFVAAARIRFTASGDPGFRLPTSS